MTPFRFEPWPTVVRRKPIRRELRLLGWNRDRTALLLQNELGQPTALRLALPDQFGLRFFDKAAVLSTSMPVALVRAALHIPACRGTREEAEAIRGSSGGDWHSLSGPVPEPWELCAAVAIWPEGKKDDQALARRLRAYLKRRRRERTDRLRRIARLPDDEAKQARQILNDRYTTIRPRPKPGKSEFISIFKINLSDVKAGALRIRDQYLAEQWAKRYGFDLDHLRADAAAFHRWLAEVACNGHNRNLQTRERCSFLSINATQASVLEASVRYELQFANGSRIWLVHVEETTLLTPQDTEDFTAMSRAAVEVQAPPWHSEGFETIWRRDRTGKFVKELPLNNEFRALCQLLAACKDQHGQFAAIERAIGPHTRELDLAAGEGEKASMASKRRIRDLLRTQTGRRLRAWGVIRELEIGREKFLKLSPPSPG